MPYIMYSKLFHFTIHSLKFSKLSLAMRKGCLFCSGETVSFSYPFLFPFPPLLFLCPFGSYWISK